MELLPGIAVIPVIVAVIELAKLLGYPKEHAPILAVVLGLVASFGLQYYGDTVIYEAAVQGLIAGLSAVGLYSGVKNEVEAIK